MAGKRLMKTLDFLSEAQSEFENPESIPPTRLLDMLKEDEELKIPEGMMADVKAPERP